MPFLRCLLLSCALWACAPLLRAQPADRLPGPVAQALRNAGIPTTAVGIVVQDIGAGAGVGASPRLAVNAGQALNPASLMKLLTTYAALDLLGPAYTWKTEAWITGKIENGVLDGDLWLKGGGDPKLTFEQFWLLLRQLRARGVREIRGDLVLDRQRFDLAALTASAGEGAILDDQPLRPYNVGPDALLLNFKALRVQLIGDAANGTFETLIEPRPANLDVINLIKPLPGACGDWKVGLRADVNQRGDHLILAGGYPSACGRNTWNIGVLSHAHYVEGVFRQLWQELGGTLRGGLREAVLPADARLLASIESSTLAETVRDINKYSNNVMARQLFLGIAVERSGAPARPADAEVVLRAWLAQQGLRFPELVLENGSGLSRHERIAAGNLAQLLAVAWRSPLMPEFVASLPLAGIDGTMKKRLRQPDIAAGRAHIKTGSLEGVKAVAGYVLDRTGQWQVVVFIVNHPNAAATQDAQDALLQWVHARGG